MRLGLGLIFLFTEDIIKVFVGFIYIIRIFYFGFCSVGVRVRLGLGLGCVKKVLVMKLIF